MATGNLISPKKTTSSPDMSLDSIVARLRAGLPELAEDYHIRALGIFGSVVRGESHPESDLDLLVDFSAPPSLFEFVELQERLSQLTGLPIDLVMKDGLKPHIGRAIQEEVMAL